MFERFILLKCEMIITVHDYFWINPSNPNMLTTEYEMLDKICIPSIYSIFKMAKIVFPLKGVAVKYSPFLYNLTDINYAIIPHSDLPNVDISEYYSSIEKKVLKILYVGYHSEHKGFNLLIDLCKGMVIPEGYSVELHLLGSKERVIFDEIKVVDHGEYENEQFYDIFNNIRPNLLLLLSLCYETYSYTCTLLLRSGLPIFYNHPVYNERLEHRRGTNIYPFDSNVDNIKTIGEKYDNCLKSIVSQSSKPFVSVSESDMVFPKEYCNFYNN